MKVRWIHFQLIPVSFQARPKYGAISTERARERGYKTIRSLCLLPLSGLRFLFGMSYITIKNLLGRTGLTGINRGSISISIVPTIFLFVLAGCGEGIYKSTQVVLSIDAIKLISKGNVTLDDPNAYGQAHYSISDTNRLLLRYEKLSDYFGKTVSEIYFQLTLSDATDLSAATEVLEICPIIRDWMMLATWELAHPYSSEGRWKNHGADFDGSGCIKGKVGQNAISELDKRTLLFDIKNWFRDYPQARSKNDGHIVISSKSLSILGETSSSHSPRLVIK